MNIKLLTGVAALSVVSLAKGNIVTNGTFEADTVAPNSFLPVKSITGWTFVGGRGSQVQRIGVGYRGAPTKEANLVGNDESADAGLRQVLTTVPGATYRVRFDVFTGFGFSQTGGVNAQLGGTLLGQGLQGSLTGNGRKSYAYDYLATGATTSLTFTHDNSGSAAHIDNVSVELAPVPEPATLITLGLGGLAMLRRKRAPQSL